MPTRTVSLLELPLRTTPLPPPTPPLGCNISPPRARAHTFPLTVMCIFSQLSEKLDSVRERAGTILQSLVNSDDPRLPFIPEREALTHAIKGVGGATTGASVTGQQGGVAEAESVNWASPAATFPIVVGLLAVPEYHDAIGEGGWYGGG